MPAQVVASRGGDGRWTLERNGTSLVAAPGVSDDELIERIEELLVLGWLDPSDRISILEPGHLPIVQPLEAMIGRAEWEEERRRRELPEVCAERYAGEERYV